MKRMKRKWKHWGRAAGLCLLIMTGCSDDPPIGPVESAPDYVFLFNGASTDQYWRYEATTTAIDTFTLNIYPSTFMAVTPDQKLLLVPQHDEFAVVSCDSLVMLERLPYSAHNGLAVSPDGRLAAIHGRDVVRLFRTADWTIVRTDSIVSGRGMFSDDSQAYFCTGARAGETQAVHIILVDPLHPTARKTIGSMSPDRIVVGPAESRWYVYDVLTPSHAVIAVFDVTLDSVLTVFDLPSYGGDMVLSRDGTRLWATAPGSIFVYPPVSASDRIFEFDTQLLTLAREIDLTTLPTDSTGVGPTDIGSITVSDAGTRLIGCSSWNTSYLVDLDLTSLSAHSLIDFGRTGAPNYMSD